MVYKPIGSLLLIRRTKDLLGCVHFPFSCHVQASERRLRWLGHIRRMENGCIPKDLLYGKLVKGSRSVGRPRLRFKDVCRRDMRICHIDTNKWEVDAENRAAWRLNVKQGTERSKVKRRVASTEKRARKREKKQHPQKASQFLCGQWTKDCHSGVGLHSHLRRCR